MAILWDKNNKTQYITVNDSQASISTYNTYGTVRAELGYSTGKYYFEVYFTARTSSTCFVGISSAAHTMTDFSYPGSDLHSLALGVFNAGSGFAYYNGASVAHSAAIPGTGSGRVRVAVDLDAKKIWYSTIDVWDGDPVAGTGFAHSFAGNNSVFYPTLRLNWNAGANANAFLVRKEDLAYPPPVGYSALEDGVVSQDLITGKLLYSGQPLTFDNAEVSGTDIQLDHTLSAPALILTATANRVVNARAMTAQSGLVNQMLVSGKWFWEFSNANWNGVNAYVYQNIRCGIARRDADLTQELGRGDEWMLTCGAWNENRRVYHGDVWFALAYDVIGVTDVYGIALDLSNPVNGKLWFSTDGVWIGDPAAGTGASVSGLTGAWFPAVSVSNNFMVDLRLANASTPPAGFSRLDQHFAVTGAWGNASIRTEVAAHLTVSESNLILNIGSHLLRSSLWNKTEKYWLGLLSSINPPIEISGAGYARQSVRVGDAYWDSAYSNLERYTFAPFNGTVVGWALYASPIEDYLITHRALVAPIICSMGNPGIVFQEHHLNWSFS